METLFITQIINDIIYNPPWNDLTPWMKFYSFSSSMIRIEELQSLRIQFGTLKRGHYSKYLPFTFTEQGVAMLSGILNTKRAIQVNI